MSIAERIVRAFDATWARNDVDGFVSLFAEDATLESPLVARFMKRDDGVLRGRDQIRGLVRELMRGGKPWGRHEAPLFRGNTIAMEFRGPPSDGEEFFSVDMIEIKDGKIQSLRAYVGWRALTRRGPRGESRAG